MSSKEQRLIWFFVICYFTQGMAGIAYEPVSYLLKDQLHLGSGQASLFILWMTLPLTVKPLFGLLTDLFPVFGQRRLPHMILASFMTSIAWVLLAYGKHYQYTQTLILLTVINVGFVLSDIVCDAVMVENGNANDNTATYQSMQIATLYLTLVLTGIGGGWLVTNVSYKVIFLLAAFFPLLAALSSIWIVESQANNIPLSIKKAKAGLIIFFSQRRTWAIIVAIFLINFSPFLGTAQFYYQTTAMKLTPIFIGLLSTVGGISGVMGALIFKKIIHTPRDTYYVAKNSITLGALLTFLYCFYLGPKSILMLTVFFSLIGVIFRLAWMDIAARSCPEGSEATTFAFFMAVFNLAAAASNAVGGYVYEYCVALHGPMFALFLLTFISALCTFSCKPLLNYVSPDY